MHHKSPPVPNAKLNEFIRAGYVRADKNRDKLIKHSTVRVSRWRFYLESNKAFKLIILLPFFS